MAELSNSLFQQKIQTFQIFSRGAMKEIIKLSDKEVVFEKTIRTEIAEDDKSWWNGLHILVIEK